MTIKYDTATTLLTRRVHGITGVLRSGASQGLRNYTTFIALYSPSKHKANDRAMWDVADILRQRQTPLEYGVPELYPFTIGRGNYEREVAAIHGLVDVRIGGRVQQEYRFVVVFKAEIEKTLRAEFKIDGFNARRYAQELSA